MSTITDNRRSTSATDRPQQAAPSIPRPARHQVLLAVIAAVALFVWYLTFALQRWDVGVATNYDMGIFTQSAKTWAAEGWPYSTIRQLPLLGDHFTPIHALLAVAWRIWPDPRVLLVVQSCGFAVAGGVVVLIASYASWWWAALAGVVVAMSRGLLTAALFDYHEVAFAVPAVAIAIYGLLRRNLTVVLAASLALCLTKEDQGFTVMGIGAAWYLLHGKHFLWRDPASAVLRDPQFRRAALLALLGLVAVVVATITISMINPTGSSPYLKHFDPSAGVAPEKASLSERFAPLWLMLASCGLIGMRSPLILIAIPTVAWRVLAGYENYVTTAFHHDAVPTIAAVAALAHVVVIASPITRDKLTAPAFIALALVGFAFTSRNVARGVDALYLRVPSFGSIIVPPPDRLDSLNAVLSAIPPGSTIAANNDVGAYATRAHTVYHLTDTLDQPVHCAVFTTDEYWDDVVGAWDGTFSKALRQKLLTAPQQDPRFTLTEDGDIRSVCITNSTFRVDTLAP